MKINQLTPSEELLMTILWKLNSAYMREVMEAYPEPKPHQNTISTFIKILVEKDFLKTEKEGRIFKYTVAVPFEDYRKFLLKNFLENYFENSSPQLIKTLVEENLLAPNEFQQIFGKAVNVEENRSDNKENQISYFIEELTSDKKKKKKKKKSKSSDFDDVALKPKKKK